MGGLRFANKLLFRALFTGCCYARYIGVKLEKRLFVFLSLSLFLSGSIYIVKRDEVVHVVIVKR